VNDPYFAGILKSKIGMVVLGSPCMDRSIQKKFYGNKINTLGLLNNFFSNRQHVQSRRQRDNDLIHFYLKYTTGPKVGG
jgi:hypothetical protein